MKRRILSIITALALCLSLCPTWALAAEADPSLCKHHPAHTEDCGYIAPTEGHDCGHAHGDECYSEETRCAHVHDGSCYSDGLLPAEGEDRAADACAHVCSAESGCVTRTLDCQHLHDSACGYVQGDPGTPCGYACRICPIEDLIAALPEQVAEDNADDVRGQLDHILDLYRELNEDEQGQLDLSRVTALQEALDAANAPVAAAETITVTSNTDVTLIAEDGGCQGHTFTGTAQTARIYVESGAHDVTFSDLNITASAMVGVAPGATMNLTIEGTNTIKSDYNAGIYVPENATLVITAESTGTLDVSSSTDAGIGGGAFDPSDSTGYTSGDPNCGTVEIKGGTVAATGGSGCAGIGGGKDASSNPGNGGTVTISGGTVTAKGGSDGNGGFGGAGIGGSTGATDVDPAGNGGTLTINGGHVRLTAGNSTSYGFGQGTGSAPGGTCQLTLADASYLDSSTTLDPKGKYTINGDPTADMIVVPELVYTGEALDTSGIKIDDTKTGTGTYFGQTFTVKASAEGWELQPLGEVKAAGEYTAVFKKGDKEISKTFTVAQSGTDLTSEGKVKTYKDGAECSDFTAGDTIKVVATPTPTGAAPQKAAARLRADPTEGQMVVFVNNTQVSEPAGAGEDGSYTMTVSAADVLLAANGPKTGITLTAKFVGNTSMADGEGTVKVNITAAAKAERDGNVIDYFGVSDFEGINGAFFKDAYAGATVALLDDITPASDSTTGKACSTAVNITCTLDLAGHNFTSTDIAIYVLPGGNLTIQDSSTGKTGTVSSIKSDGTLKLYGGTFGKIETAYTLSSLLAENCAYYRGSPPIPLSELEGQKTLDGTVTVQECRHKDVTPTAINLATK